MPLQRLRRVLEPVIRPAVHLYWRFSRPATLGAVREAMVSGLTPRLIGEGMIDEDDEGVLLEEIDELIRRFGKDALAETVIRFE